MTGIARNAVTEGIATFLFVFAIIAAVNSESVHTPLAIGFTLMVLVYATGHLSGAHLNPAVTLGVWLRGAISLGHGLIYWVSQALGAVLAALASFALFPKASESTQIETGPAFIGEAFFTFLLVFVVLNVATSRDTEGNSFYGLAIGAVIFVGATTVGPISGGGFNPAVALGLSVSGQFDWSNLWLFIAAPLVGGALAALAFRLLNAHDLQQADAA